MKTVTAIAAVTLSISIALGEEPEPIRTQSRAVILDKGRNWMIGVNSATEAALLPRELARQALLIAAHDELGQYTRDVWLGEGPTKGAEETVLELVAAAGDNTQLELLTGKYPQQRVNWQQGFKIPGEKLDYVDFLIRMEGYSRGEFVHALKAAGIQSKDRMKGAVRLPNDIDKQLDEITFTSQFMAVRSLHRLMREHGESPEILGALVRAYANLGVLTDYFWRPVSQVFQARSLLYAQRLFVQLPNTSTSYAHRAYALALAGFHAQALADLEAVTKARVTASGGNGEPGKESAWITLINLYCRFDVKGLQKAGEKGSNLAQLLMFLAMEHAGDWEQIANAGALVLKSNPECYRIYETLGYRGSLGTTAQYSAEAEEVLGQRIYERLEMMKDLPPSVLQVLRQRKLPQRRLFGLFGRAEDDKQAEFKSRAALVQALKDSGGSGTSPSSAQGSAVVEDEFTFAILGQLLMELSFAQTIRRVDFMIGMLGAPPNDTISESAAITKGHPFEPFLRSLASDVDRRKILTEFYDSMDADALTINHGILVGTFGAIDRSKYEQLELIVQAHTDPTAFQLLRALHVTRNRQSTPYIRELLEASPHSPFAKAELVEHDWVFAKNHVKSWEKDALEYPILALQIGRRYVQSKEYEKAERLFKTAIEQSPSRDGYRWLADLYKAQNKIDLWQKTLEEFLTTPVTGLEHAQVQDDLAKHFKSRHEWDKAEHYAAQAAQSGSAWGMQILADVYEASGRFDESEEVITAVSKRYQTGAAQWYFFCKRTGTGDLAGARELAKQFVAEAERGADVNAEEVTFVRLLEGDTEKALAELEGYITTLKYPAYYGLHAALLADRLGKKEKRDAILRKILKVREDYERQTLTAMRDSPTYLTGLIAQHLLEGKAFNLAAAEKVVSGIHGQNRMNYCCFLATYLDQHGDKKKAIEYWQKTMLYVDSMSDFNRTLAGAALAERDVPPGDYLDALKKPVEESDKPQAPAGR